MRRTSRPASRGVRRTRQSDTSVEQYVDQVLFSNKSIRLDETFDDYKVGKWFVWSWADVMKGNEGMVLVSKQEYPGAGVPGSPASPLPVDLWDEDDYVEVRFDFKRRQIDYAGPSNSGDYSNFRLDKIDQADRQMKKDIKISLSDVLCAMKNATTLAVRVHSMANSSDVAAEIEATYDL